VVSVFGTGAGVLNLPVLAAVGGAPAEVVSTGLVAGSSGMFEAQIRVPQSLAAGNAEVIVTIGGAASQKGAMLPVR
jgi:uncharacterized protein (TIGR03437 family)